MNANQQSALAALRSVSPIAAKLDRSRDGEDRAADILELWQGTETALRALAGGSSLGGQALIRELRQQELISLGQAYALLEFLGARDRANRTTYRASDNDVAVAREGFRQLETGLAAGETEPPPLPPRPADATGAAASPYAPGSYAPPGAYTPPCLAVCAGRIACRAWTCDAAGRRHIRPLSRRPVTPPRGVAFPPTFGSLFRW
jgi:hypothetical protein